MTLESSTWGHRVEETGVEGGETGERVCSILKSKGRKSSEAERVVGDEWKLLTIT